MSSQDAPALYFVFPLIVAPLLFVTTTLVVCVVGVYIELRALSNTLQLLQSFLEDLVPVTVPTGSDFSKVAAPRGAHEDAP